MDQFVHFVYLLNVNAAAIYKKINKKKSTSKVPKLLPVPGSNLVVTQSLHRAFCVQTKPLSHFSPGACGLHSACHRHKLSK